MTTVQNIRSIRLVLAGLLVCALAACGSSSSATHTSAPSGGSPGSTITIKGFKYQVPSSVRPGQKLTVRNDDNVAHTVTATAGKTFDVKIAGSGSATLIAPSKAGSYTFTCTYHPYMHGTLVVRG
jgi:plastocyanin